MAQEVGLDPALIEQAAAVLPAEPRSTAARILGGPDKYQMQYSVPVELSSEGQRKVIDAVRQATGHHGKVEEVMGSLEWQTVGEVSVIQMTVSPSEGSTTVRVLVNRGPAGGLQYGLTMVAGFAGMGIVGAILEPTTAAGIIGVVVGTLGTAAITARTIWATTTKSFRKKLNHLMSAASRAADEAAEAASAREESNEG